MLELRDAIPKTNPLAVAEFVTLREKLLKIGAASSRPQAASNCARHRCPQAGLFRILAGALQRRGRERRAEIVSAPRATTSNSNAFKVPTDPAKGRIAELRPESRRE